MKKFFAFTALASAAMACSAQTSLTVYGIVDAGVTKVSGLKGGSIKQLSSGIMEGTRLGFSGSEDLGGGWRALFLAESRIEADTGAVSNRAPSGSQVPDRLSQAALLGLPAALQAQVVTPVANQIGAQIGVNHLANNFWDRQIYLGLVTPVGAILAGRQYTPAYELNATFDTMNTQSSLAFGQIASFPPGIDIRVSNSLAYRIRLGGFSGALMAAAAEGSTSTGKLLGFNGIYKAPQFSVGVGYNTRENEKGAKSLTSAAVGATLNLGPGVVTAQIVQIKDDNPTGLSGIAAQLSALGQATAGLVQAAFINATKQDARAMHIGYKAVFGPNTWYTAYSKLDDRRAPNADTASYGVAYSYAFSKRTDVSAVATRFVNSGLGQSAPGGQGYIGGVTAKAGDDSTSLALGIRHRF
ncbi:MAG: porin [Leptothrix sp. (in: Bacteria)]|nr:porin [Leptothrix sp. (in: b-proteobacteria)]